VIVMTFTPRHRGAGTEQSRPMNTKPDQFARLTITDLQLIARARGITLPADANRDQIVTLLGDTPSAGESAAVKQTPAGSALNAPTGWWTSFSVGELRTVAREHGINVPAGTHRHELVGLLIEHDVSRPPRPPSSRSGRQSP